jgi:hypothetical protein
MLAPECVGGGGTIGIVHDDGSLENGYSGNPAVVNMLTMVDLFTPPGPGHQYTQVCIAWTRGGTGAETLNFEIVFYDDDGPGNAPGTLLASLPATSAGIPAFPAGQFYDYDVSAVQNIVSGLDGDIYIGARWDPIAGVFLAADESAGTPLGSGQVFFDTGDPLDDWEPIAGGFTNYRSMLIRAEVVPTDLILLKTASTDGTCGPTNAIDVAPGTDVTYCYRINNTDSITLSLHDLDDSELGSLFSGLAADLGPGDTVTVTTSSVPITQTTVNTATWTAYNAGPTDVVTATAIATVNVPPPSITVDKTVGTEDGVCATTDSIGVGSGTDVYYCYEVTNTGLITLALHDLDDSELGTILSGFAFDLGPGASVDTVAAGLTLSATITETTVNTATWTAYNAGPTDVAVASDSATVNIIPPSITVDKTVGTTDGVCATTDLIDVASGTDVYYCYEVTNTGPITLALHDLVDSELGSILSAFAFDLGPGASVDTVAAGLSLSATITETTVNSATWTAYNAGPIDVAASSDTATVLVAAPEPLVCNGPMVGFENGIPSDWVVADNEGIGLVWTYIEDSGELANYTGSSGNAATASSDAFGPAEFDTEMWSAPFDLTGVVSATLEYQVNYQNLANLDFLDVDISTNGGTSWTNLLSWNEDHGSFRSAPGELVSLDLSAYTGQSGLILRWHYYDPNSGDWDWYAQVDDVTLDCVLPGQARLAVAHLAPFASGAGTAVTVTLNSMPVLTNVEFADSTGYLTVTAGTYDVEIIPAGTVTPAITATVDLMDGMDYSAIAIGDGVNQPLELLALLDDNSAPPTGTAKLRIGHLAPFASVITDTLADVRLQDGTVVLNDVPYGTVDTGYSVVLPAGTYDLKITNADGSITLIDHRPVTLNDGDILSVFAVGEGTNQPLGVFAWPSNQPGFLLPLGVDVYLPAVFKLFTP